MRLTAAALFALVLASSNAAADKPSLSLVIDDLGYALEPAQTALGLPGDHTYAILPSTYYSREIAEYAHERGREIILHMPMQSSSDLVMEPTALHDAMTETELTAGVEQMLSSVPYISGINNHMGSKLTRLDYVMRAVMETISQHQRSLYFLDSRTTALSTAYQQARYAGLQSLKRDVFLDYDQGNDEALHFQLQRWLTKAQRNGHAVAIGHPYRKTIDLLQNQLPELLENYRFLTLSQALQWQHQETPTWPTYLSHLHQDSKNSKPSP